MTTEPVPPAERKRLVELAEVAGLPWQRPHWLYGYGVFISDATAVHYAQLAANLAPRLVQDVERLEADLAAVDSAVEEALIRIGTGTDCQCQGERCIFCDLRRLLHAAIGDDTVFCSAEVEKVRRRRKEAERERGRLERRVAELEAALVRLMGVCRNLPDDPEFPANAVIHALVEAGSVLAKGVADA